MHARMRYEKRNGRNKQKNSNNQGGEERRTYVTSRKKQDPLLIAAIAGGAVLVLIIIIFAASGSSGGDSDSTEESPAVNLAEEDRRISELRDSGGADEAEGDRLVAEDDRIAADRCYRKAYDKFDAALAIVRSLAERYPQSKYSIQEQELERQLADIKSKAGFNIGE